MLSSKIKQFLVHMETVKRSQPLSILNYKYTLEAFAREYTKLTEENVSAFLQRYPKAASANVALVRLQGLAKFIKIVLDIPRAKEPHTPPEALSSAELSVLVENVYKLEPMFGHIVLVLANTSMRLHEFRNLGTNKTRLCVNDGVEILEVLGKGQKLRYIPIGPATVDLIRQIDFDYIKTAGFEKKFRKVLHQSVANTDLPRAHPHLLRSTFASILLNEKKRDSANVIVIGGWASADTLVKRYYKPSMKTLYETL